MDGDKVIPFPGTEANQVELSPEEKTLIERRKEALSKLQQYRGEIASRTSLRKLPNIQPGEIFWITMDNAASIVTKVEGSKVTMQKLDENASISAGITIYEMNKNIVSKEPLFDWNDGEGAAAMDEAMRIWTDEAKNTFFLLYGRDIHYFTLFECRDTNIGLNDLKDVLNDVGDLISIDFNSTNETEKVVEIWVRTKDSLAELIYLFPYDRGIVKL